MKAACGFMLGELLGLGVLGAAGWSDCVWGVVSVWGKVFSGGFEGHDGWAR